ncbi:MAG: TIGR03621 family F420-dependent LLM class oxidoreductase [Caldilineaceae bacterium]|nr:TIGR03621 family F420-dependent LLM class oxidoreductase [Caldilineaceae bacterium]
MNPIHPFRFGIACNATSRAELVDQARQAENFGYATLVFEDHLTKALSPIPAMVAAAEATTKLRVGSYVFGNDFRHPVQLARDAATVDLLTDGRLELGLGTGWARSDYEQAGLPLDPPGVRVDRLQEAIQVLKGAWRSEPFSFTGNHYQIKELTGLPTPAQRPHPRLMIGGGGKRMLSIATQEADIVSVNARTTATGGLDFMSLTAEATDEKIGWIRAAAGERFADLELNVLVIDVTITADRRRSAAEGLRAYGLDKLLTVEQALAMPVSLIGTVDEIVEQLIERRARFGFSYIVLMQGMVDFAPIVARLAGK